MSLLVLMLAASSSCTRSAPPAVVPVSSVATDLDEYAAVVYLSTPRQVTDDAEGYGYFIPRTGSPALVDVGPLDVGLVSASSGRLALHGLATSYLLEEGRVLEWERGRPAPGIGHWSGFTPSGTPVAVLNSGGGPQGYETEVFAVLDGGLTRSVVPDVPGAVGATDDAVWVLNAGSSVAAGEVTVHRVPLGPGADPEILTTFRPTPYRTSSEFVEGSNLFEHRGRLWFLEQQVHRSDDGTYDVGADAVEVRLSSVDLSDGTYSSRPLTTRSRLLYDGDDGTPDPVAAAASQGHLHDGRLHQLAADGELVSVALDAPDWQTREVEVPLDAPEAEAAWHGDSLDVLTLDRRGRRATLERISLEAGTRTASMPADDLAVLLSTRPDLLLHTMATLDAPAR
ncbi:hypothetical protein [Nocardioides sp.]|uniref:hypothetical protein n=1 Tax=Nocardioides sp. TaxID=35761 RepID=UPI00273433DC|nr:hypothetical protein [Nocardioides sp.]MDP3890201.1 hypothetical protein [Nocardioides sp.]